MMAEAAEVGALKETNATIAADWKFTAPISHQ